MDTQLVHSFTKNDTEEIRMSLREYKSRLYMDVRLYFQTSEQSEMLPSKKGLTIGVEFLPELKRGLIKLEEAFRQMVQLSKDRRQEGGLRSEQKETSLAG